MERNVRKTPRQSRSKETVAAIEQATVQILRDQGLDALTTAKIAKRAGVSVGTLYQYFPNKEVLLESITDRLIAELAQLWGQLKPDPGVIPRPKKMVRQVVRAIIAIQNHDPVLLQQLQLHELRCGRGRLDQLQADNITRLAERLRGAPFPIRPKHPEMTAKVLVRGVGGVVRQTLRVEPEMILEPAFEEHLVAMILGILTSRA